MPSDTFCKHSIDNYECLACKNCSVYMNITLAPRTGLCPITCVHAYSWSIVDSVLSSHVVLSSVSGYHVPH